MGAVELVDCRIRDWQATTAEAVADNALHAGVVLGPFVKPISGFDLIHEGVIMRKNGCLLASACGVEALGNPVRVVTWLANKLTEIGRELKSGDVVLTGSLTKFFHVDAGDGVEVSFTHLGNIQFALGD